MSDTDQVEDWKISLGARNNLLYSDIPYVPILVEDIPIYLALKDHEENGIKTIQTLGELIPESESRAMLLSLTAGNSTKFPISFKNISMKDLYIKDSSNRYEAIWDKYAVFKVYGTLKEENGENVLETTHLVPVRDVQGTWNVMTLLIATTRLECRHYYRTRGQNRMLKSQWEKMKAEKKRRVKEKKI